MGKGGGSAIGSGSMEAAAKMFQGSGGARKAMFKQLASALATGGRGMRSGVVQQAMARSRAGANFATTNAAAMLSPTIPGDIRGRVLNRISQTGAQNTAGIAPAYAAALAAKAPAAIFGANDTSAGMSGIQMAGEASALQAAQTRAAGWANAAQSVAGAAGTAAGSAPGEGGWWNKYFGSKTANSTAGPYTGGYRYSA